MKVDTPKAPLSVVTGPHVRVRPATADDHRALGAFFARAECACHCQYWSFAGDHREWQLRLATEPELNARALEVGLGSGELLGVLAEAGVAGAGEGSPEVVGWSRLARSSDLDRLYRGRLYRGLPCFQGDRSGVMTVGCVLVAPKLRRRGIARRLLGAQVEYARQLGARALEAFPRGATDVSDGEQWMGPLTIYRELGFVTAHDFPPYPVLRKDL